MYQSPPSYATQHGPTGGPRPGSSARNPHAPRYRYRMRWDNLAIIGAAIAVCAIALPWVLGLDTTGTARTGTHTYSPPARVAAADHPDESLTLDEANDLVAQARAAMLVGRFDDAANLLSRIGGTLSDQSGASALRDENARRQAEFEQACSDAMAAVEARRWTDAVKGFDAARKIAPLTPELEKAELTARRGAGAAAIVAKANAQLDVGNTKAALTVARHGYSQYPTAELAALVRRIAELERAAASPATAAGAGAGSTIPSTAPSAATTAGSGGAVTGSSRTTGPTMSPTTTLPPMGDLSSIGAGGGLTGLGGLGNISGLGDLEKLLGMNAGTLGSSTGTAANAYSTELGL